MTSFPKNIIFKIIDSKIDTIEYSDLKKLTKLYLINGHHYKLKCVDVLAKEYELDTKVLKYFHETHTYPSILEIIKMFLGIKNFYIKMLNLECYDKNHLNYITKTINTFYPFVGLLSRIDQINDYKKELSFDSSFLFFGMDPFEFDKQLNLGNFTHNSFYNILLRHGLIFTLILFYFLSNLFIRSTSFYFDIIFMIIITTQLFDDYLIGNRSELSFFIWFLLSNFYRQNKIKYD